MSVHFVHQDLRLGHSLLQLSRMRAELVIASECTIIVSIILLVQVVDGGGAVILIPTEALASAEEQRLGSGFNG
jgi:hypothetical protein